MSCLIYSMKIFIFRQSGFRLTNHELKCLKDLSVFAVKFYINLLVAQELLASGDKVSLAALKKLKGQFWYLSEELIGFSFFDESISVEDKINMVEALAKDPAKRIILSDQDLRKKVFSDFVTKYTKQLFDTLGISTDFLKEDPT